MKARIIRVGRGQAIRIPKALLEQTGLSGEVEISARGNTLVIRPGARGKTSKGKKGSTKRKQLPELPPYEKLKELAEKYPPPASWFEEEPMPRAGWDAAFKQMAERGDDEPLDGDQPCATSWDEEEWDW